jgi:hypothetical protein
MKHICYLTEKVVVLVIFDRILDPILRKGIVVKLLSFPPLQAFAPGKYLLNSRKIPFSWM